MSGLGAVLGLAVAAAAMLAWSGAPTRQRQARLRVSQLLAHASGSTLSSPTPAVVEWLDKLFGGRTNLAARLRAAGMTLSPEAFRLRQVATMAGAAGLCLAVEALVSAQRTLALGPAGVLLAVCATAGLLAPELLLDRSVRARRSRVAAQLPHVAELVAFALSAGESPLAAVERVVRTTSGPLTEDLSDALIAIRGGQSMASALRAMADNSGVRQVERFVDGLLIAVERGTPLADVMRAQAADARAAAHRDLLAQAGRAEVLMLVPVIFLVLPTVVVIALYPGLSAFSSAFN